jgi:hypothetical protein
MSEAKVFSFKQRAAIEIHEEAIAVSKNIKAEYMRLFEILLEVEARQIYHQFDLPRLHVYCTEMLDLSRNVAKDFVTVVRKALEVPQLQAAICVRGLSISKARKICPVITNANCEEWVELALNCTCRVIEKTVAMAKPSVAKTESLEYLSADHLSLKISVSEEWTELLTRMKELLAQKNSQMPTTADALFVVMKEFCQRHDPVEKAKRSEERLVRKTSTRAIDNAETSGKPKNKSNRTRYRHRAVEHVVNLRDESRCVYVDKSGRRCEERKWLAKHHVHEFALGGGHSVENLKTLCWAHHKMIHKHVVT